MKISPLSPGGIPSNPIAQTADASKLARAKAIAAGEQPVESTGDQQVDKAQATLKKIKMRTQVSTNRHENENTTNVVQAEAPTTDVVSEEQVPITDTDEPAPVVEETKPLSPQFAALARQKRANQVKELELAKREEALKEQSLAGNADYISKADLLANPLKIFESGLTYDQLTEAILANQSGVTPEIQSLKAELKALKEELNGQFTTRDTQQEQQVLAEIKREAQALIAQSDEYEAIRAAKAQNHPEFANGKDPISSLIHRTWKKTGEVMDVSEAAELVENQLIEEAIPFAKTKKVQSRLTPQQEQVAQTPIAPKPGTKVMRTLTNRDNASPVMDRRQRAIAAMNGTLRKG